jgi:hypothetical protein
MEGRIGTSLTAPVAAYAVVTPPLVTVASLSGHLLQEYFVEDLAELLLFVGHVRCGLAGFVWLRMRWHRCLTTSANVAT